MTRAVPHVDPAIPLDPDAPWQANVALVLILGALGLWVWWLTHRLRKDVGEAKESAGIAAVQAVPNHGSSMRDAIDRVELSTRDQADTQRHLLRVVEQIVADLGHERERLDSHISDCIADWRTGQPPHA